MRWLTFSVLITALCLCNGGGGGVTKTSKTGLEQYWMDDYKLFEKLYGMTSDKEIYGVTLPPNVGYEPERKHHKGSEKNERYYHNGDESDNYNIGIKDLLKYNNLKSKFHVKTTKDFIPISKNSDPETYFYLKNLENFDEEERREVLNVMPTFKPLDSYEPNPEETNAYISLQEKRKKVHKARPNFLRITKPNYESDLEDSDALKSMQQLLHAHEANKGKGDDANSKYITNKEKSKPKKIPSSGNNTSKPRCYGERCKLGSSFRSRPRPYYRIKKRIVY